MGRDRSSHASPGQHHRPGTAPDRRIPEVCEVSHVLLGRSKCSSINQVRFLYVRAVTSDVSSHLAGTLESREWRIVASPFPRERTRVRIYSTRLQAARLNPSF